MHNRSKADHDALTYHPQARWMPGGRQPVAGMGATLLLPYFNGDTGASRPSPRPRSKAGFRAHRGFRGARTNDKTARRMTSRKISTVAEQLRARGLTPCGPFPGQGTCASGESCVAGFCEARQVTAPSSGRRAVAQAQAYRQRVPGRQISRRPLTPTQYGAMLAANKDPRCVTFCENEYCLQGCGDEYGKGTDGFDSCMILCRASF